MSRLPIIVVILIACTAVFLLVVNGTSFLLKPFAGGYVPPRISREVKFIAGPDGKWFTPDDVIYHYFTYDYDPAGRMQLKKRLGIGPDGAGFTADDVIEEYQRYAYRAGPHPTEEISYDGPGRDNRWQTADDREAYHARYQYDLLGHRVREVRREAGQITWYLVSRHSPKGKARLETIYTGAGEDNRWFTGDDVIEKYHRFVYLKEEMLYRCIEYLPSRERNRKHDYTLFIPHDAVNAAREYFYDPLHNRMEKLNKYIKPGPDGEWFTVDDELQYYTLYEYVGPPVAAAGRATNQ